MHVSCNPETNIDHALTQGDYYSIDAAPALSALGLGTYITLEQSVVDTVQQVSKAVQN